MSSNCLRKLAILAWPAAVVAVLSLLLVAGGCERLPWLGDRATGTAPAGSARGVPPDALPTLSRAVAEARRILPSAPAEVTLPQPPAAAAEAPTRLVLSGEGSLLRPSAFPDLPRTVRVELHLTDETLPGGYLLVAGRGLPRARWRLLPGYATGRRDAAFSFTWPVAGPAGRLWYFHLLGLPYQVGPQAYRSVEGYLVRPGPEGTVSSEAAVVPVDFGYRWAEPPAVTQRAASLRDAYDGVAAATRRLRTLRTELAETQEAMRTLQQADVPAEQEASRREDLANYRDRIQRLERDASDTERTLVAQLAAAYEGRTALAEQWRSFAASNPYRWRTPDQRRALYEALAGLNARRDVLTEAFEAVQGITRPALAQRREALEAALREEFAARPQTVD